MDLNVKCKTMKLTEHCIGKNLGDLVFKNDFLDIIPKARSVKENVEKWSLIKIKKFLQKSLKRMKSKPESKKMYMKHI
jgi:hypothetical protein